jgi:dynactin complex subunit
MNAMQTKLARQLLNLNQTEFAALLGWTSKRNVVSLERGDKEVMTQTALAIECLLRRNSKFEDFEMLAEIQRRLDAQKTELESRHDLTNDDVQNIVFSEDDVVEAYLRENDISEADVDLEFLRDLQHFIINDLK